MTTLDRELVVLVYGDPAPKGSLKCVGTKGRHQLIEDNPRSTPWRARVAEGGRRLPVSGLSGALSAEVTLTVDRPPSHYGTGRNAGRLKDSAPAHPITRASHDVDKLARLVLDALQDAGTIEDDARVVELLVRKTYPDGPGVLPDALHRSGARIRLSPL